MGRKSIGNAVLSPYSNGSIGSNKFKTLKEHFNIHIQYCDLVEKWTKDHDKFTHLWNIGSNVVSCIPGYSTHVEGNMLSPTIKWHNL